MVHAMVPHCYGEARRHGNDTEKIGWTWEGHGKNKMDMGRTPERACATLKNKMDMGRTPERAYAMLKPYCPQI